MALIRINAEGRMPVLHGAPHPLDGALGRAIAAPGPITVMIHGYKFLPNDPVHCPHLHILATRDAACRKALSWPRRLGFGTRPGAEGLGIAFGWKARGTLGQALHNATSASHALAVLIRRLRTLDAARPVHLIGHSMGGHVALRALRHLDEGDIGRVLLLNAAAFCRDAEQALATPAGHQCELFNITSAENALYDRLFACLLRRSDATLGHGLSAPNALTLRLDDRHALQRLSEIGFPVGPPRNWYCHWSTYLRPGVFPFYSALIREPARLPLPFLQGLLSAPPHPKAPRRRRPLLSRGLKQASWPPTRSAP